MARVRCSLSAVAKPKFARELLCVGKLSPRSTQCTPLHRFGIHNRKMGKKGPGQNNPENRRKQENERPISGPQQATQNFSERGFKKKSRAKIKNEYAEQIWSAVCLVCIGLRSSHRSLISKFSLKIAEFFAVFFQNFANLPKFGQILLNFRQISPFFSGFFQNAAFFLKDLILAAK